MPHNPKPQLTISGIQVHCTALIQLTPPCSFVGTISGSDLLIEIPETGSTSITRMIPSVYSKCGCYIGRDSSVAPFLYLS